MKLHLSLSLLASLAASSAALAVDYECATFSAGRLFRVSSYNQGFASHKAITDCNANYATSNSECNANVSCTYGPAHENLRCSTYSAGRLFESASPIEGFASHKAIFDCNANYVTSSSECRDNVSCEGRHPNPGPGGPGYPPLPPGPGYPPNPNPDYPPNPGPGYPPNPGPGRPSRLQPEELVGQWKASNCSYCYLQVRIVGRQLSADMNPWDQNRSASGGPQRMVLLSDNLLEYRGDTFRIEQTGRGRNSNLRIVNTRNRSQSNVQSAELDLGSPMPDPNPPVPVPPNPRGREHVCTLVKGNREFRARAVERPEALRQVLAQCSAAGKRCKAANAVCTRQ